MDLDPAFAVGLGSSSSSEEVAGILSEQVVWSLQLMEEALRQTVGVARTEKRMAGNCREVHSWNTTVVLVVQRREVAGHP